MTKITPPGNPVVPARVKYLNELKEKSSKSISEVHDTLVSEEMYGKLPERLFIELFLPYFSGEKSIAEDSDGIIAKWISVAGSPANKVRIIDDDMNTLFVTPPLFSTSILNTLNNSGVSLSKIYHNYTLRKNNLPIVGERYLDDAMSDKAKNLITDVVNLESERGWQDIFSRYNKINIISIKKDESFIDEDFFDFS